LAQSAIISSVTTGSCAQDTPSWQKKNFLFAYDSSVPIAIR